MSGNLISKLEARNPSKQGTCVGSDKELDSAYRSHPFMAKRLHNICSVTSRHRTSCRHWHLYNAAVTSLRCSCFENHFCCVVRVVARAWQCDLSILRLLIIPKRKRSLLTSSCDTDTTALHYFVLIDFMTFWYNLWHSVSIVCLNVSDVVFLLPVHFLTAVMLSRDLQAQRTT